MMSHAFEAALANLIAEQRANGVDANHQAVVRRVRETLAVLPWDNSDQPEGTANPVALARAWKLVHFFTQPFFVSERYTRLPGSHVSVEEAIRGCDEIIQGQHDGLPVEAFYFTGSIDEIRYRAHRAKTASADHGEGGSCSKSAARVAAFR